MRYESIWDIFPWFPIKDGEDLSWSPLINHRINIYGVYCLDNGKGGAPEIHPIDAMWWKDSESTEGNEKWYFGVTEDYSQRFEDDWSEPPRTIVLAFPISINLPDENEDGVTVRAYIRREFSNRIITSRVLGPDEDNSQLHKIIHTPDGKQIDIWVEQESEDYFQNVDIRHIGRADNTYFGIIRVSVAVGEEGLYFGSIELKEDQIKSYSLLEWPRIYARAKFIARTNYSKLSWDHYQILVTAKGEFPEFPQQMTMNLPYAQLNIPIDLLDTTKFVSVFRQGAQYSVNDSHQGEWAIRVKPSKYLAPSLSHSIEKPPKWQQVLDLYVNPNAFNKTQYPYWLKFKVDFPGLEQTEGCELIIKD